MSEEVGPRGCLGLRNCGGRVGCPCISAAKVFMQAVHLQVSAPASYGTASTADTPPYTM
jgi:hypothetical protein